MPLLSTTRRYAPLPRILSSALIVASIAACGQGNPGGSGNGGAGGGSVTSSQSSGGGGAGGCDQEVAACVYKTDTEIDEQSFRQIAGYNCHDPSAGWEFVATKTCDYTEVCKDDSGTVAVCVACGPEGQAFAHRTVDGEVVEDCQGCSCHGGWSVYGCYADGPPYNYGAAWADIVWQEGFEVIRFALLTTGEVKALVAVNKVVSIQGLQVSSIQIQPNGLVDFTLQAQVIQTDNFQQQHTWNMDVRVVGICK